MKTAFIRCLEDIWVCVQMNVSIQPCSLQDRVYSLFVKQITKFLISNKATNNFGYLISEHMKSFLFSNFFLDQFLSISKDTEKQEF